MTERSINLVVPLAHKATDMRITETADRRLDWPGAVSQPKIRPCDVESTIRLLSPAGPGIRTSTTATRTTTTRTTSSALGPSADRTAIKKRCALCERTLSITNFYRKGKGWHSYCKLCHYDRVRELRAEKQIRIEEGGAL